MQDRIQNSINNEPSDESKKQKIPLAPPKKLPCFFVGSYSYQ